MHPSRLSRLAVTALLALAACKDAAGPEPPADLGLVLSASFETPAHETDAQGTPFLDCTVHFFVRAEGPPTERAVWTGMVLRYFAGADRTTPVDSAVVGAADVALALGGPKLDGGEDQRSSWRILSPLPFVAELELRYTHRGTARAAATRTPCGAQPEGPTAAPSAPSVTLSYGELLEPGDGLGISWSAAAAAGLWETGVIVAESGARVRFAEQGRPTASRGAHVVVPRITGVPLTLQVYAMDVLGRVTTTSVATPAVQDRTPPEVLDLRAGVLATPGGPLAGQFGAGDILWLDVHAMDNDRIAYLRYGRSAPEDSVALGDTVVYREVALPIPPSWAGSTGFSVQLRDRAGNASAIVRSASTRFYPVRTPAIRQATLSAPPRQVVLDEARGRIWIRSDAGELRVLALDDLSAAGTVALSEVPEDMDVTVGGDTLVVALGRSLSRIDLREKALVGTVALDGVAAVWWMRMAVTGEAIVLGPLTDGGLGLLAADPTTGRTRLLRRNPQLHGGPGLERSGDGRRFLLGRGCVYDLSADQIGACGVVASEHPIASDGSGSRWASGGQVLGPSLDRLLRVTETEAEGGAWLTDDGAEAFLATERGPLRVRVSDGRYLEGFRGFAGGDGLAATRDGSVLLVWDTASGRVARMTLR